MQKAVGTVPVELAAVASVEQWVVLRKPVRKGLPAAGTALATGPAVPAYHSLIRSAVVAYGLAAQ
jgi:hypothetical protein